LDEYWNNKYFATKQKAYLYLIIYYGNEECFGSGWKWDI
jgi:hypothetical protein